MKKYIIIPLFFALTGCNYLYKITHPKRGVREKDSKNIRLKREEIKSTSNYYCLVSNTTSTLGGKMYSLDYKFYWKSKEESFFINFDKPTSKKKMVIDLTKDNCNWIFSAFDSLQLDTVKTLPMENAITCWVKDQIIIEIKNGDKEKSYKMGSFGFITSLDTNHTLYNFTKAILYNQPELLHSN